MTKRVFLFCACLLAAMAVVARQAGSLVPTSDDGADGAHKSAVRPDQNVQMVGVGAVSQQDTYLSPENYTGTEVRFVSLSQRRWRRHPAWRPQTVGTVALSVSSPRADNSDYLGGSYTFSYALRREFCLPRQWTLEAGAQAEAAVGFLYSTRNDNNPAQARAYANVGPSVAAGKDFRLWRLRLHARYEAYAPLLGLLFSPNYGQSYYELFTRGDYEHNLVPTTPVCAPTLRQQLSLDVPVGKCRVRVGYMADFQQARANQLKYHTYSHLLLLGLTRPLSRR